MSSLTSSQSPGVMLTGRFVRRRSSLRSLASSLVLMAALLGGAKPIYSQNDALSIDNKGNVGIGTKAPSVPLEVNGDAKVDNKLTVSSLLTVGSGIEAKTTTPTKDGEGYISKTTAIQLFQGTGILQLQYIKSLEKAKEVHRIGFAPSGGQWMSWNEYGTNNMYIGGNLGIGTDPTAARLKVDGDINSTGNIKLGKDSSDYASSSSENLRMVRGTVDAKGNKVAGEGFTSHRLSDGAYRITFTNPFSGLPSATANQLAVQSDSEIWDTELIGAVANDGMSVYTGTYRHSRSDRSFSFIVMGPR